MPDRPVERKLTAILAADVAGYSRLMGADEVGTLQRLQAHRRELIDPKVAEHKGRLVKTTGDGLLIEFPSVVEAVTCAVAVQREMAARNNNVSAEHRIVFRVGVNLGDIVVDGEDIYGDGVNVAARLEALAEPGGICIGGSAHEQVRDKLPYSFDDLRWRRVKNIARPVRVFAMRAAAVVTLPSTASPSAWDTGQLSRRVPRLSIVVLPLANLSNDPDQEYFVDAITDDLTTDLSRIVDSFVISRTTAFTYKGKAVDVKQIGRELGVGYVLEGSVRRLGEEVQVNVQLIDAKTGAHIWADRFDTDRSNLARAQRDITARLARTLHVQLLEVVGRQIDREERVNLDARDFIMRGWAGWHRPQNVTNWQEVQWYFERALELDPQSARARIGIATVLIDSADIGWSKSRQQDIDRTGHLLVEALERDRSDPKLHWAMGRLRRIQLRFAEAKMEFEEAIALDHNDAGAILQLGFTLSVLGQPEAALPHFEKALRLNPRSQNIHFFYYGLGQCQMFIGHLGEAVDNLRKARAANHQVYFIPLNLAAALGLRGDVDEARDALAESLKLRPEIRSLADLHRLHSNYSSPPFAALWATTIDVGLRRAGFPDK